MTAIRGDHDLVQATQAAALYFRKTLLSQDGQGPRAYLTGRGFSTLLDNTPWTVGYAPRGWTRTLDHLRALGFDDQTLVDAGLVTATKRGSLIDRFRDRITFGIRNPDGVLVSFVARAAPNAGPASPKYLGTPPTAIYRKGDVLFGYGEQLVRLRFGERIAIVEGPLSTPLPLQRPPRSAWLSAAPS